jgi:hypothetical protein
MEGPQFSSLAESLTFKSQGYSVIGMTNMPEAKLAREAEICYASVAMVTDFDCWHPDHDAVTVQDIIRVLNSNAEKAKGLVARLARDFPRQHEPCPIGSDRALDTALITAPEARDPDLLMDLRQVLEEDPMSFVPSADLLRDIAVCVACTQDASRSGRAGLCDDHRARWNLEACMAENSETPEQESLQRLVHGVMSSPDGGAQLLSAFDLGEDALRRYAEIIRRYRPEKLYGYASALGLLARYVTLERLHGGSDEGGFRAQDRGG